MTTENWEPESPPNDRPDRPPVRFSVGLTIATLIAMAILIGLGVWQLQRLKWKEGLLAHVAALQSAKARDIGPVLDDLKDPADADFTRVSVVCPGLASAPFVELYGIREGQAGVRLISACPVTSLRGRESECAPAGRQALRPEKSKTSSWPGRNPTLNVGRAPPDRRLWTGSVSASHRPSVPVRRSE